jgi:hypothetical protein
VTFWFVPNSMEILEILLDYSAIMGLFEIGLIY